MHHYAAEPRRPVDGSENTVPGHYGATFVFTLFTNDPEFAIAADAAGVDRIGLDLDKLGKAQRQRQGDNLRLNDHFPEQLAALRQVVHPGGLFVRTNPLNHDAGKELETLIDQGVDVLMLPFFNTVAEAERFIALVDGRARVVLLVETITAANQINALVSLPGVDEIHIGLNDLYLSMNGLIASRWELLVVDLLNNLSAAVREAGLPFHLGGLGRANDADIPIPCDLVYAQWPRLKATSALMARSFFKPDWRELDLHQEVLRARRRLDELAASPPTDQEDARAALRWWINHVANP